MDDRRYSIYHTNREDDEHIAPGGDGEKHASREEDDAYYSGEMNKKSSEHAQQREKGTSSSKPGRSAGGNGLFLILLILLTGVVVIGFFVLGFSAFFQKKEMAQTIQDEQEQENAASGLQGLHEEEQYPGTPETSETKRAMVLDVSDIVQEAMPSIVAITNKSVQEVRYFFRGTMEIENESSGSGFIIAENEEELLIATNYHVIEGAASLSICFTAEDMEEELLIAEAVEKGSEPEQDLAIVAVQQSDIPEELRSRITVAPLGSSEEVLVGEPAIAIGNALGYGQSVTLGIISAKNRELTIDGNTSTYLQTDAAINFGNSGGALFNVDGQVIGINSAKATASDAEGMGYAIPIDAAKPVLEELMNRKTRQKAEESERGYLGIYTQDISSEARSLYGIPSGVYISEVADGSAAEAAGLKRGDILSRFDGSSVTSTERLSELMEYFKAGEIVEAEILVPDTGSYEVRTVEILLKAASQETSQQQYDSGYGYRWPNYRYGY